MSYCGVLCILIVKVTVERNTETNVKKLCLPVTAFEQFRIEVSPVEPVDVVEIKRTDENDFSRVAHHNPRSETKK